VPSDTVGLGWPLFVVVALPLVLVVSVDFVFS